MQADWELSQSFVSDGQGFRVACVLPASSDSSAYRIVAGTQGGSLWEFEVPSGNLVPIDYQHNHAVTALICGKDVYITGCKDHVIRVFNHEHALLHTLEGHEKAVTSLSLWGDDYLISGSWDGTAKVWNLSNKSLVATCAGHENTVSVCAIGCEGSSLILATGSAGTAQNNVISNHSIRIWSVHLEHGEIKVIHKVSNDHDGPIRDVCLTAQGMLASCSNDGTVKLRSVDTGETLTTLATMVGEAPMLLSLTSSSSYLAASAEDGHVFVWSSASDTHQVIRHASCVWSVAAVPTNGDLISCCQDGTLRIFTQSTDRMAPAEEREAYAIHVQEALRKHKQGPSQEEVSQLPKWEMNALQQGKSEGQVSLFQKDGIAIAAQWSMASQTWIEVGQVMGSSEDAGTIDGVKYDHVLPIEVDTTGGGVAKLQIGYNNGENPFVSAQRFIDAHMLPQYHLAQIADYIRQRVGHQAPTLGNDSPTASVPSAAIYQYLPVKGYKSFELGKTTSLEKMQSKLAETGKLNDKQLGHVQSLIQTLGATNRYHATKIQWEELAVIMDMLKWPSAEAFPALDLARLTVLHPDASTRDKTNYWNEGEFLGKNMKLYDIVNSLLLLFSVLLLAFRQCRQVAEADGTAAVAVPMLSLRLVANCFRGGPGSLEAVSSLVARYVILEPSALKKYCDSC